MYTTATFISNNQFFSESSLQFLFSLASIHLLTSVCSCHLYHHSLTFLQLLSSTAVCSCHQYHHSLPSCSHSRPLLSVLIACTITCSFACSCSCLLLSVLIAHTIIRSLACSHLFSPLTTSFARHLLCPYSSCFAHAVHLLSFLHNPSLPILLWPGRFTCTTSAYPLVVPLIAPILLCM